MLIGHDSRTALINNTSKTNTGGLPNKTPQNEFLAIDFLFFCNLTSLVGQYQDFYAVWTRYNPFV